MFAYSGAGARLVTAWKYGNDRRATGRFTSAMATVAPRGPHDVVTWAPTSAHRRRERGFDPARLLAAGVATRRHLVCRELLSRRRGPAQTGRSASERRDVTGFVSLRPLAGRVLLVDDVCTTGSTLAAATAALLEGGADAVDGVVLARTPTERVGS